MLGAEDLALDLGLGTAREAEAAGASGELVTDPGEIDHALRRGLKAMREEGRPAVISVWLATLLQKD